MDKKPSKSGFGQIPWKIIFENFRIIWVDFEIFLFFINRLLTELFAPYREVLSISRTSSLFTDLLSSICFSELHG